LPTHHFPERGSNRQRHGQRARWCGHNNKGQLCYALSTLYPRVLRLALGTLPSKKARTFPQPYSTVLFSWVQRSEDQARTTKSNAGTQCQSESSATGPASNALLQIGQPGCGARCWCNPLSMRHPMCNRKPHDWPKTLSIKPAPNGSRGTEQSKTSSCRDSDRRAARGSGATAA